MWRKFGFWSIVIVVIFCQGCGRAKKPLGTIRGHVTFQHRPVTENAYVIFSNAETKVAMTAALSPDGAYEVKTYQGRGLPPGNYRVAIVPRQEYPIDQPLAIMPPKGAKPSPLKTVIPTRYHNAATSRLTVAVAAGENPPFDFDLTP
jgi:hypothetical protein